MKKKQVLVSIVFVCILALCTGCGSMLTYSGEDYDKTKAKIVQTNESFVFSTYAKELGASQIGLRMGISKSPVESVLVAYIEFTNKSNEDYIFLIKDIKASAQGEELPVVNYSEYLNAYQGEQAGMMASMQSLAPQLKNMAAVSNRNFGGEALNPALEHASNNTATKDIADIVNGIANHTVNSSGIVKAKSTKYYYMFFYDIDEYPIEVGYRGLQYTFTGTKKTDKGIDKNN